MKNLIAAALVVGGMLGLSVASANATTITTDDYGLSSMSGSWAWGDYNVNRVDCCGALGYVDNVADLSTVETMMSDGLPAEATDVGYTNGAGNGPGGSTGIYNWDGNGTAVASLTFAFDGGTDASVDGVQLGVSRSSSDSTTVRVETRTDGGVWTTSFFGTDGSIGLINIQSTASFYNLGFSSVIADEIRLTFDGFQIGLNEFLVLGEANVAAVPIPAALPLLLSALGFFGFLGWRRKKAAA